MLVVCFCSWLIIIIFIIIIFFLFFSFFSFFSFSFSFSFSPDGCLSPDGRALMGAGWIAYHDNAGGWMYGTPLRAIAVPVALVLAKV